MSKIGEAIRIIRKRRHLSQVELARDLHTKQGTISNYETGRMKPGYFPLLQLLNHAESPDEKQPILEGLGELLGLEKTPGEDDVQEAVEAMDDALERVTGLAMYTPEQKLWRRFLRAVKKVMEHYDVNDDFCRFIELWGQKHGEAEARKAFSEARGYLEIVTGSRRSASFSTSSPGERRFLEDMLLLYREGDPLVADARRTASVIRKQKAAKPKEKPKKIRSSR